ncbi:MAG TPA: RebB family R body protein [Skermanella sp.]|jgi:hypothetical protein|nr:RebB family R body protein [Skermanella sp.]
MENPIQAPELPVDAKRQAPAATVDASRPAPETPVEAGRPAPEPPVDASRRTDRLDDAGHPYRQQGIGTTDAVTQSHMMVLGTAPAHSMAALYQSAAQATSLSMQNAVAQQQQMNTISNTVTAQCLALLITGGTPAAKAPQPSQADGTAALAEMLKSLIAGIVTAKAS